MTDKTTEELLREVSEDVTTSRVKVIGVLNRLLASQCYSLVNYLNDAPPWLHPGNEALAEATSDIVSDHEHYSQRLAEAIEDRDGSIHSGSFPIAFMSLNDLTLDYLLASLVANQLRNIKTNEQCVTELVEDPQAWSLASEVLGSERAHLATLRGYLPRIEPTSDHHDVHKGLA